MAKILPEIHHVYKNLTMEDVAVAHRNNETVTGFVERASADEQVVQVRLGIGILATMPFSEATIYPLRFSRRINSPLPTNIRCLINRKIRVKITEVNGDSITVSRRMNMLEAYEHLKSEERVSMFVTEVIPKTAFGDIGDGIVGKIFIDEVSKAHVNSIDEHIKWGDTVDVVLLEPDDKYRFNTSYKRAFKPYDPMDYTVGDTICCKVGHWIKVGQTSKYYVSISPRISGIMTINYHNHLDYGTNVECVINAAGEKGLFLDFVKAI